MPPVGAPIVGSVPAPSAPPAHLAHSDEVPAVPARSSVVQPAAPSVGVSAAAPASFADVPPWEDEQVPYGDGDVPVEEGFEAGAPFEVPTSAAPAVPTATAAPAPVARTVGQQPAADGARAASPSAAESASEAGAPEAAPDDLQAILQAGFGDGASFEEVLE